MSPRRIYLIFLLSCSALLLVLHFLPRADPIVTDPNLPSPHDLFAKVHTVPQRQQVVGYERSYFGKDWGPSPIVAGCSSRQAAIMSQAVEKGWAQPGASSCYNTPIIITDPYSGAQLDLTDPRVKVEVDHVFPLAAAWDMGAWGWNSSTRYEFANDPLNLVATSQILNRDKSDRLPSQWLPPRAKAQCWYAQRLCAVADKYALHLEEQDLRRMQQVCRL